VTLNTAAIIPFGFKLTQLWIAYQQRALSLQNEKLQTELKLLKNQMNPHFLFNTLNSLFALSKQQRTDTPEAIMRLSGMMRYMLYDSNEKFVSLESELDYLSDYIALEKLRFQDEMDISFAVFGEQKGKIAPLILLPFIENAFKHGRGGNDIPWVSIHISIKDQVLEMNVENSAQPRSEQSMEPSGIGLTNVKKRLSVLYPNAYTIKEEQHSSYHRAFITIPLQS
ncbi:MAG: sensor histidine kinase, partial [Flammeovirgaceae bacterium]